ncbi:MAG TPA: acyl carrier protein [Ferruginibacter sp.]|nr:acyl carrier protein [Ferruginibacter sp.]
MTNEELIPRLKEIIRPYIRDEEAFASLNENTDFLKDLKINSANLVDVILDIESAYDIIIDNESMEKMLNVKAAIDIINAKLNEK